MIRALFVIFVVNVFFSMAYSFDQDVYYDGEQLLAEKYFAKAEALMKMSLENEPNTHQYYALLSEAQLAQEKYKAALTSINAALVLKKNDPNYLNIKATIYLSDWKLNEAKQVLDSLVANYPLYDNSNYEMLAYIAYLQKDYATAEEYLITLNKFSYSEPEYRYFLSLVLLKQHKYEEAIDVINKVNSTRPIPARYYVIRGTAEIMLGNCDAAMFDADIIKQTVTPYDWDSVKSFKKIYEFRCETKFAVYVPDEAFKNIYNVQKVAYAKSKDASFDDKYVSLPVEMMQKKEINEDIQDINFTNAMNGMQPNIEAKVEVQQPQTNFQRIYYELQKNKKENDDYNFFKVNTTLIPPLPKPGSKNKPVAKDTDVMINKDELSALPKSLPNN